MIVLAGNHEAEFMADPGRTLAQVEQDIERDFDKNGFAANQLIGDGSLLEARLNGTGKGRGPGCSSVSDCSF